MPVTNDHDVLCRYWFSTQTVGHCNATTEPESDEQCTWRVAEVKKVVRADCVNGQIIAAVLMRNASCFAALPPGERTNRTTDGWIGCFFNSLLGNHSSGQPALAGTVLETDADVAALRQAVLGLWLDGFSGSCPAVPSENLPDPPATRRPPAVQVLTLYLTELPTGGGGTANMTNRNSADAPAVIGAAFYSALRLDLCAAGDSESCAVLPELSLAVLTAAKVRLNTLHGQYANCSLMNGSYHCFGDWECWCEHDDWGGGGGSDDQNPCLRNGDSGDDYCPCLAWGGCGGGKWGPPPADGTLAVGRRRAKQPSAAFTVGGHEYSTTAGGECDGSSAKKTCSWKAVDQSSWRAATLACVEAAVVAALDAATAGCRAARGCGRDTAAAECRLDCTAAALAVPETMASAEAALAAAFAVGSQCLV